MADFPQADVGQRAGKIWDDARPVFTSAALKASWANGCPTFWNRCAGPTPTSTMFRASWDLLVAASYDRPGLVPASLWARVHAGSAVGALFAWAADDATRDAHANLLGDRAARVAGDVDAARRAGIPAGVLTPSPG